MSRPGFLRTAAALLAAAMLLLAVAMFRSGGEGDLAVARAIGRDLLQSGTSVRLARVPPLLAERLADFSGRGAGIASVHRGDAPIPFGDGRAQAVVVIQNEKGERIGIRLRIREGRGASECLGFWTLPDP